MVFREICGEIQSEILNFVWWLVVLVGSLGESSADVEVIFHALTPLDQRTVTLNGARGQCQCQSPIRFEMFVPSLSALR